MKKKHQIFLALLALFLCLGVVWILNSMRGQEGSQKNFNSSAKNFFLSRDEAGYHFFDLEKEKKLQPVQVVPEGFEILEGSVHDISVSDFFILQKDRELFSYGVADKILKKIPLESLGSDEVAVIAPSITETNHYYFEIEKRVPFDGILDYQVESSRKFFYDADTNSLQPSDHDFLKGMYADAGCYQYDSKNKGFFVWLCAEGIGTAVPLSFYSLDTGSTRELIRDKDVSFRGDYQEDVGYSSQAGEFYVLPQQTVNFTNFLVLDFKDSKFVKELYKVPDPIILTQFGEEMRTAFYHFRDKKLFVFPVSIGEYHGLLFMRYDESRMIKNVSSIWDEQKYRVTDTFTDGDKFYYYTKYQEQKTKHFITSSPANKNSAVEEIHVYNLDTWEKEKTILLPQ